MLQVNVICELPADFQIFAARASAEGHEFVSKMYDEWESGKNRFQGQGEVLVAVMNQAGELAGIGGLNVDPYTDDQRIGRIRHVYVAPEFRKMGAGKMLLERLIAYSQGRFSLLRLKTHNPLAVKFYRGFGFTVDRSVVDPKHTYMLAPLS